MSRPTYMMIDLDALRHNLDRVRHYAGQRSIIAMVKANAYGHGIIRVAQALSQANALGVASLEEGIKLREAGITQPIVLMEGLFFADELAEVLRQRFSLVVHHEDHINILENYKGAENAINVWLKINTGMHRLGIAPQDTKEFYNRLVQCPLVRKPVGLMTHFAQADNLYCDVTNEQLKLFNTTTEGLDGPHSLANSAAIIAWPATHGDWVRPGLMLYGASPFPNKTGAEHDLRPVMTLSSRIIAITKVIKGGRVGYGGAWTAPEDMVVGVVGVGYGDGYPQFAENGTPVLVNQQVCPLVGRVSMDMLTVDLRQQSYAKIGDPVILWGAGMPVENVAHHSKTSAYEILTRMTPRPKIEVKSTENVAEVRESLVKHEINV